MERICSVHILDVPYSADRPYSYSVPRDMEDSVCPGTFVEVPFGRGNRPVTGLCVSVSDGETGSSLKSAVRVLEDAPVLDGELLGLCLFLSGHTLCTVGEAVRTVVPPGALGRLTEYYRLLPGSGREGLAALIDEAFGEKKFTKQDLCSKLGRDVSKQLAALVRDGAVERSSDMKGLGRVKTTRILSKGDIPDDPDGAETVISGIRGENRKRVLRYVVTCGEAGEDEIAENCGMTPAAVRSAT